MSTARQLQLVVVTPEKTLLDQPVTSLVYPLFDGLAGIKPGRAPMVGRLGAGELKFDAADGSRSYFVDGGFVQVKGSVVSILTHRAIPTADLDRADAERQLADARASRPSNDAEFAEKRAAEERARRMISLAGRG